MGMVPVRVSSPLPFTCQSCCSLPDSTLYHHALIPLYLPRASSLSWFPGEHHICADTAYVPTHGLDDSLQKAAAAQTMSGLSLTPPIPLKIRIKRMARELLQEAGRQKDGNRWAGRAKRCWQGRGS